MDILIIGLGVIGTTYGSVFKEAGHNVEHYIREGSNKKDVTNIEITLLDGRKSSKGIQVKSEYTVNPHSKKEYDMIFISISQGKIANVMEILRKEAFKGTILLCCNLWYDKQYLDGIMQGYDYVLGFPVAGGCIRTKREELVAKAELDCCLFDHFMIESENKTTISNYKAVCNLFKSCNIKLEKPYNMLEWIWIHMAVNAAVISVIGKNGYINDSTASVHKLMNSLKLLTTAIKTIRETTKIAASRGINMKYYRNELWVYKLPAQLSAIFMKRMFATNNLTRRIMELHGNIDDLQYICNSVYNEGKTNNVPAPVFYQYLEDIRRKMIEG